MKINNSHKDFTPKMEVNKSSIFTWEGKVWIVYLQKINFNYTLMPLIQLNIHHIDLSLKQIQSDKISFFHNQVVTSQKGKMLLHLEYQKIE